MLVHYQYGWRTFNVDEDWRKGRLWEPKSSINLCQRTLTSSSQTQMPSWQLFWFFRVFSTFPPNNKTKTPVVPPKWIGISVLYQDKMLALNVSFVKNIWGSESTNQINIDDLVLISFNAHIKNLSEKTSISKNWNESISLELSRQQPTRNTNKLLSPFGFSEYVYPEVRNFWFSFLVQENPVGSSYRLEDSWNPWFPKMQPKAISYLVTIQFGLSL